MDQPLIAKLTPHEVRNLYYKNTERVRGTTGLDVATWSKLWMTLIRESGWGFMDVMRFIQSGTTKGDQQISVHLSVALSNNNLIWKAWFFAEFPDFVRDLGMKRESDRVPFPWLEQSRQNFGPKHPHYNSEDEALFSRVIWRSCYMWAYMFRRQCGKYMLHLLPHWTLNHITFMGVHSEEYAEHFRNTRFNDMQNRTISEVDGETKVEFTSPLSASSKMSVKTLMQLVPIVDAWMAVSRATPYLVYLLYISNAVAYLKKGKHGPTLITEGIRLHEHVLDAYRDDYAYNFPVETIESFIRWYVTQMERELIARLGVPGRGGEQTHPLNDIFITEISDAEFTAFLEAGEPLPPPKSKVMTLLESSEIRGFYIQTTNTWPHLEGLSLCPRRISKSDPDKRAVQFLGKQIE